MPGLTDPGLIRLNQNGRLMASHYRLDLFEDGVLAIASGDLSFSQGFMGSFAAELLLGTSLGFDLGGAVDLTMTADVDELLLLAQALEQEGLAVGDLFGTSAGLSIVIDESDPAKLALLAGIDIPDLLGLVTDISVPGGGTFYLPLELYSASFDLSGYDSIVAVGSAEQVLDFKTQGSGNFNVPDATLALVEEYQVTDGVLTLDASEFLTGGPDYSAVVLGIGESTGGGFIHVSGGAATFADSAFDASRINDSIAASHIYELNGSFADELGGPPLVGLGGALGANDYSFGANQGLVLTGGALLDAGQYSIEIDFNLSDTDGYRKIIDYKSLASDNGLYNYYTTAEFYYFAEGPDNAFAAGVDSTVVITRHSSTEQITVYVDGVEQVSFLDPDGSGIFDTEINFFIDDIVTGDESTAGVVDRIAIYDSVLSPTTVAAMFAADSDSVHSGHVQMQVVDDADNISLQAVDLGSTIDDFPASYTHLVGAGDTVTSFPGAMDHFYLEEDVYDSGIVSIDGDFDLGLDVLDISLKTNVYADDDDGGYDFTFIGYPQPFGTRTASGIAGKDPVDISIWEASTHIQFDGLTAAYDGTTDFEIVLSNNIAATLDVTSFRGLPGLKRISEADFNNAALIPLAELQRFPELELQLPTAPDAFAFLDVVYNGAPTARQLEVTSVINPEGDVIMGTAAAENLVGDSLAPALDDVIFGGDGNDTLAGGAGADWLDGGSGNDALMAAGAALLNGGTGDDTLTMESGVFSTSEDIIMQGHEGADTLLVAAGADLSATNSIEIYGRDGDVGTDGNDSITIAGSLTSTADDIYIEGNEGDDSIVVESTGVVTAQYTLYVEGGLDADTITVAGTLTSLEDDINILGDAGTDTIIIEETAVLTGEDDMNIEGGADDDVITVAGSLTALLDDLYIIGDEGADTITITETAEITSLEYYLSVEGNAGDDVIMVAGMLSAEDDLDILGDDGLDTITIADTAVLTSYSYEISIGGGIDNDVLTVAGVLIALDDDIDIDGNAGMDVINVGASAVIAAYDDLDIQGGADNDTINVSGMLTTDFDDIAIEGEQGADTITIPAGAVLTAADDLDVYGFDGAPGIDGNDVITIGGMLTAVLGDLDIEGNDDDDIITIAATALLLAGYDLDIEGNAGNDTITIAGGLAVLINDILITGGGEADTITIAASAVLTTPEDVEIFGDEGLTADGADTIEIYGAINSMDDFEVRGGGGMDTITLDGTFSAIDEGDTTDSNDDEDITIDGGEGDDIIALDGSYTAADDIIIEGDDGNDSITLAGSYTITGDPFNFDDEEDRLVNEFVVDGGEGNDSIDASALVEDLVLRGDFGVDTILGGAGDDEIEGGQGVDMLTGGAGMDVFSYYSRGELGDTIMDFSTATKDLLRLDGGVFTGFSTSSETPLWRSFTSSVIASNPDSVNFLRVLTVGVVHTGAWVVDTTDAVPFGISNQTVTTANSLRADANTTLPTSVLFKAIAASGPSGHTLAFQQLLTKLYAPSQKTTSDSNSSVYFPTDATAIYMAFALISTSDDNDTRLMMALIINRSGGLDYGGTGVSYTTVNTFNQLTLGEIATIATIAQMNGVTDLPANLLIGDLILI